jgi:hypothetical protein
MRSLILFTFLVSAMACHRVSVKPDDSGMFMKMFGDADNNFALAAEETPEGHFLLVGSTVSPITLDKDILFVKTDKNGNKIWEKRFGGSKDDEGFDVKIDADGAYLVLGYKTNENGFRDFYLIKTNTNGDTILTRTYGDANKNEEGRYIKKTNDNNLLLGGIVQTSPNATDMYFVKTNLFQIEWEKPYGVMSEMDELASVEVDGDNFVICGSGTRQGSVDMRIAKVNKFGILVWDYSFGFNNNVKERGYAIKKVTDGFVIVGTAENEDGASAILLVKIDDNGKMKWEKNIRNTGNAKGFSLDITSDGDIIITGSVEEAGDATKIFLMKTDANGNVADDWPVKLFGGNGANQGRFVKQTKDNGFLVLGISNIVFNNIMVFIKTNKNGELVSKKD